MLTDSRTPSLEQILDKYICIYLTDYNASDNSKEIDEVKDLLKSALYNGVKKEILFEYGNCVKVKKIKEALKETKIAHIKATIIETVLLSFFLGILTCAISSWIALNSIITLIISLFLTIMVCFLMYTSRIEKLFLKIKEDE